MKKKSVFSKAYWWLYWKVDKERADLKTLWQRLFSPLHLAGSDAWNCHSQIVRRVYPLLLNFKLSKRVAFHIVEEFNDKLKDGILSDEFEEAAITAWEQTIDKMIFACEWVLADEGNKRLDAKIKRRYGDWHAKKPENRYFSSLGAPDLPSAQLPNGFIELIGDVERLTNEDKDILIREMGEDWEEQLSHYYDIPLHQKLEKMAQEGFELFGKYLWGLWD